MPGNGVYRLPEEMCEIHASRMGDIGLRETADVLWEADSTIRGLRAELASARSTGTGQPEAEDEPELPAGEPITEEASDEAIAVAQAIEAAIQVRGVFSYAPDGRPCLTWYGEQRIAKVIDAHLEEAPEAALHPPAREGEGDHA